MTASEEQQFVQLLDNMMALDNNVRAEAEVREREKKTKFSLTNENILCLLNSNQKENLQCNLFRSQNNIFGKMHA